MISKTFVYMAALTNALGLALACSSSDSADSSFLDAGVDDPSGDADGGSSSGDTASTGGSTSIPEEIEDETYRAPVVTGRYLWSANPISGRVAVIDGKTLAVRILSAGLTPTELVAVPTADDVASAIVLNRGSADVTWFRLSDDIVQQNLATHVGANNLTVSKTGSWAVAWSNAEKGTTPAVTEGFQEVSILSLDTEKAATTRLTVGYRPSQIMVAKDDSRVLVVSADGVTTIALGKNPQVTGWLALGEDAGRDVSLTDDGRYALVRYSGKAQIDVFDLDDETANTHLDFPAAVTDLDLAENGRALAIMRTQSRVSTFLFPDVLAGAAIDTAIITGENIGSAVLSPQGDRAVLFTNATENDRVTVLELTDGPSYLSSRSLATKAPVLSASIAPDGRNAVILAGSAAGPAPSFAVIALTESRFPRVVGTDVPVAQLALSNDAALVTASDGKSHRVDIVQLSSLSVNEVTLSTEPLSVGVLPSLDLGFVSQVHPDGRVTLFELSSAQARTITGFELAAEVVDQ